MSTLREEYEYAAMEAQYAYSPQQRAYARQVMTELKEQITDARKLPPGLSYRTPEQAQRFRHDREG